MTIERGSACTHYANSHHIDWPVAKPIKRSNINRSTPGSLHGLNERAKRNAAAGGTTCLSWTLFPSSTIVNRVATTMLLLYALHTQTLPQCRSPNERKAACLQIRINTFRAGEERRRPAQSPVYPQAEQSHQLPFLSSRINFLAPFPTFAGPSRDTSNPLPEQQQLVPGRSPPPPIRATVYHFIIVIHQL